jgi:hypothetical protein
MTDYIPNKADTRSWRHWPRRRSRSIAMKTSGSRIWSENVRFSSRQHLIELSFRPPRPWGNGHGLGGEVGFLACLAAKTTLASKGGKEIPRGCRWKRLRLPCLERKTAAADLRLTLQYTQLFVFGLCFERISTWHLAFGLLGMKSLRSTTCQLLSAKAVLTDRLDAALPISGSRLRTGANLVCLLPDGNEARSMANCLSRITCEWREFWCRSESKRSDSLAVNRFVRRGIVDFVRDLSTLRTAEGDILDLAITHQRASSLRHGRVPKGCWPESHYRQLGRGRSQSASHGLLACLADSITCWQHSFGTTRWALALKVNCVLMRGFTKTRLSVRHVSPAKEGVGRAFYRIHAT